MCSVKGRNKLYLSLDTSPTAFSDDSHDRRWTEIIPQKAALTFAALWDPEEGMVTFSGPALLESDSATGIACRPDVFDDDCCSQVISVGRDTDTTEENTVALATFQDAFKAFLHRVPRTAKQSRATRHLQARASSTCDGLDVYSRDIILKPKRSLQSSYFDRLDMESALRTPSAFGRFRLRSDLMVDKYHSESESCMSRHTYLKSRFSTTTTSTSNYIDVTNSSQSNPRFATSAPPQSPERTECSPPSPASTPRRRLQKRRTFGGGRASPGSPSCSSSSESRGLLSYSSSSPPASPTSPSKSARFNPAMLLRRKSRGSSDEGWICVEVYPVIKQRYVVSLDDC
ncbi:hypothetical protein PAXRUDRAFT_832660 [Paxillus rubicundulus Ve08.2h10]|uniref:Uncharacterized protein n=1 Tax=Paxillus rubicundulus Ve08.2h10 TaxID=930991 RepID=A0A0D0DJB2_9AGAM|nr:hypothetical protein PAXRUDRAFT_832660 [Paxillus rubicundulus Ve08.2h10]